MTIVRSAYESLDNPDLFFVAFDIETTGLSPTLDRIIELGAVKFQSDRVLGEFEQLIDPEMQLDPQVIEVHGITADMLKGKPNLGQVLPQFFSFASGCVLVAHNAEFDVSFLLRGMAAYGLGRDIPHTLVDTLPMAKLAFPGRQTYKLQDLATDLGLSAGQAHRALDDAQTCRQLFLRCLRQLNPAGQGSFF